MWRTRAVRTLLADEIGGLRLDGSDDAEIDEGLRRARRRAGWIVVLDWAAILVLLIFRRPDRGAFFLGPSEETIFVLGLLAIAVHSGFRLGQLEKFRAVSRLIRDLDDRAPETDDSP